MRCVSLERCRRIMRYAKIDCEEFEKSLLQWRIFGLCIVIEQSNDATSTCRGVREQLSEYRLGLNLWVSSPIVHTPCKICAVSHTSWPLYRTRTRHSFLLPSVTHPVLIPNKNISILSY